MSVDGHVVVKGGEHPALTLLVVPAWWKEKGVRMAACAPQAQTRELMEQQRAVARELFARGLTTKQIRTQLRCTAGFAQRIQVQIQEGQTEQ
jgi:hypothetical protein